MKNVRPYFEVQHHWWPLNYDQEGVLPPLNLWSYRLYEMPQHQNEAALAFPLHCICTRSRGIHICFSKVSGKSQAQKRQLENQNLTNKRAAGWSFLTIELTSICWLMIVVLHCSCKMFETPTFIKVNKQPLKKHRFSWGGSKCHICRLEFRLIFVL